MTTPTMTWTRLSRRLGSDHNPLRRRCDRFEAWLAPAAIAAFLLLSPVLFGVAGLWVRADNAAVAADQRSWHRVSAVTLTAAPGPLMASFGASTWTMRAPARWTADGQLQVARVPVTVGTRAGRAVPVWLNRAGRVEVPALTGQQLADRVEVAATIGLMVLAVVLAAAARVARWVLDRRRLASWETAWRVVGPQWSQLP